MGRGRMKKGPPVPLYIRGKRYKFKNHGPPKKHKVSVDITYNK